MSYSGNYRITLTGADMLTPLAELIRLTKQYPELEVGLLYSETPEGRNRYPTLGYLERTVRALPGRCAVHVCGRAARQKALEGIGWLEVTSRIQINGKVSPEQLLALRERYPEQWLITQWPATKSLEEVECSGHQFLVDRSGGRGISPGEWPVVETNRKAVGYAGGLGPHNLLTEVPKLRELSRKRTWWVDMENSLRDPNDCFSALAAEACLLLFREALSRRAA